MTFDALFSVSDLHVGGAPTFRIFDDVDALASLVRDARKYPADRVAFVLNGDAFDFLAAPGAEPYSVASACSHLSTVILLDASLEPLFAELSAFVATPGRTLVMVVGNHDVELASPEVRRLIEARLGAGSETIVWRIRQEGFECNIGERRIQCVHGNVTDVWNRVASGFADSPTAAPNAGSMLVTRVLNRAKQRFRWLDVLKPEGIHLALLCMVLDDDSGAPLLGKTERAALAQIAARVAVDSTSSGFLDFQPELQVLQAEPEYLAPELARFRRVLAQCLDPTTFNDLEHRDAQWKALARAHSETDVLIAGHTHAARQGPLRAGTEGGPVYLNTGTWAYVMTVGPDVFRDDSRLAEFERLLRLQGNGGWEALRQQGWLSRPRRYAFVDGQTAELRTHKPR